MHDNLSFKLLIYSSSTGSKVSEDLSNTDIESQASIGETDFTDNESDSNDTKASDAYMWNVTALG